MPSTTSRSELQPEATQRPTSRRAARLVWVVAAVGMALIAWTGWLGYQSGEFGDNPIETLSALQLLIALVAFLLSGTVIVTRQPGNVIGWLLLIPGLTLSISEIGTQWLVGLDPPPTSVNPWMWMLLWFTSWSWILLIFPIFHLLLTFPDGRLLSPRWKWAVGLEVVMISAMVGAVTFTESLQVYRVDEVLWTVPNPIGFLSDAAVEAAFAGPVWSIGLVLITLVSASAIVIRFRSGSPDERHQLKWPLFAIAVFGVTYAIGAWSSGFLPGGLSDFLFGFSIMGIPISIAIAVLRYRLYEIDRIVSRTVSYALVVGLLAGVFLGVVSLLSSLVSTDSNVTVAASTLAVAALFNPLRRRTQGVVDRRFNRSRYDTQRVMDGFAASLRDQVDPEQVVTGWTSVVEQTMQPAAIGTWLRTPTTK